MSSIDPLSMDRIHTSEGTPAAVEEDDKHIQPENPEEGRQENVDLMSTARAILLASMMALTYFMMVCVSLV
jgi:hypothetical protein